MNLISLGKLTDNNNTVVAKGKVAKIIEKNNKLIAIAVKNNSTYKMKSILRYGEKSVSSANHNKNISL